MTRFHPGDKLPTGETFIGYADEGTPEETPMWAEKVTSVPDYLSKGYMVGWDGTHEVGKRPAGIHPLTSIGGPPESRTWNVGDPTVAPDIAGSALIHAFCTVDAGLPGSPTTTIGERSFLQARVHLGHNVVVGDDVELCAGTVVCGHVRIGNGARIGGNTWIKPRVVVGDGAVIGGGSVVTKDVPAHEVWAGNPAAFMKLAWTHPDLGKPADTELHEEFIGYAAHIDALDHYRHLSRGLGYGVDGDAA